MMAFKRWGVNAVRELHEHDPPAAGPGAREVAAHVTSSTSSDANMLSIRVLLFSPVSTEASLLKQLAGRTCANGTS